LRSYASISPFGMSPRFWLLDLRRLVTDGRAFPVIYLLVLSPPAAVAPVGVFPILAETPSLGSDSDSGRPLYVYEGHR
jgi:hypothetical protein